MSKIRCDEGINGCSVLLTHILQDKINIISKRIGFDDSNILWTIYSPSPHYENILSYAILIGSQGIDYGYCYPDEKQIWISAKAIQYIDDLRITKVMCTLPNNPVTRDFLADVILDEITHIQTGLDHGDEAYEHQLKENRLKYYSQF